MSKKYLKCIFLYTVILGYVDRNEWRGLSLEILHGEILSRLFKLQSKETN